MRPPEWSGDDLVAALVGPVEPPFLGELVVITSPPTASPASRAAATERLAGLPVVLVAAPGVALDDVADLADLAAVDDDELATIAAAAAGAPLAAVSAAMLLRGSEARTVGESLHVESAVYSALQSGPEHARWRAAHVRRRRADDDAGRVGVERDGAVLRLTLQRPAVRNALDARMRDELVAALAIAEADPSLRVEIRGDGPTFCAGGDLDEFGTTPDPATGHVVRLSRSVAASLHRLSDRTAVFVHGHSAGSGVELAAFAGRVVANPDATFALPELALGLVPGAGGTVSLPHRIGRHRTAHLLFTGGPIDATTARSRGLVDEIDLF